VERGRQRVERFRQRPSKRSQRHVRGGGHDGQRGRGGWALVRAAAHGDESVDDHARKGAQRHQRMLVHEPLEAGFAEARKLDIADGVDRRRARLAGEQRELADALARSELGHDARRFGAAFGDDAHASADHDVQAVPRIALAQDDIATDVGLELQLGDKVGECGGCQSAEERVGTQRTEQLSLLQWQAGLGWG
jgi:hypothetical protein